MSSYLKLALASVSIIALAEPALAADAPPTTNAAYGSSDIIVSARRREERLQDVPKVVNAVTADDLRKNNIQKFDDVASVVPGITLQNAGNGLVQNAGMRGVSFDVDSGLPSPTVQFYLNDANIQPNWVFQSMYDIGQIEVLRGPQGTLRGRSAPSGSITLTTKEPNLYKLGGYVDGTYVSGVNGTKLNYALNVPVIAGKLAVRVAGTVDENQNNGIKNINPSLYPATPYDRTWSERLSVRAAPIEPFEINLTYQRLVTRELDNLQTESTCLIDPSQPCGSGPLITAADRESTINGQRMVYQANDIWNARADLHLFGQKLSYVGQYALSHLTDEEPQDGANFFNDPAQSPANTIFTNSVNYAGTANPYNKIAWVRSQFQSHEVRIANEERIMGMFDYVAGFNTVDARTDVMVQVGGDLPTSQLLANAYNAGRNGNNEVSWFANLTAHPMEQLELSGGARYIIDKQLSDNGGFTAYEVGPGGRTSHTIWTASASYHFTPAVMGYVNAGSAFRQGGTNLGFAYQPESFLALSLTNLPQYYQISPESSTSYEVGLKSQFLNRKLTLNVDYYHQDYKNFQYVTPDYLYLEGIGNPAYGFPPNYGILLPPVALGTENVPVKVDGVEGDFNYRFNADAGFGGSASYADGRITGNTAVPCPGSISTLTVTHQVNTCVGGPASNAPRFSGSLHADYAHPINDRTTGFVRAQMSYYGATPTNAAILAADKVNAYALFNLYAGIRAPDSAWEITLFAKNLFNDSTRLQAYGGNQVAATAARAYGSYGPPATSFSSYTYIGTPIPREFGVTMRYAFGSR